MQDLRMVFISMEIKDFSTRMNTVKVFIFKREEKAHSSRIIFLLSYITETVRQEFHVTN